MSTVLDFNQAFVEKAQWTVEKLRRADAADLFNLFCRLSAPPIAEMMGVYRANLLDQGSLWSNVVTGVALSNPLQGDWLGKAFAAGGKAFDLFRKDDDVQLAYEMSSSVLESRFDGSPSMTVSYAFDNPARINLECEIRRIAHGLYLGMGSWGFTGEMREKPAPFVLWGPVDEFHLEDHRQKLQKA